MAEQTEGALPALAQTSTPLDVGHLQFDAEHGVQPRPADQPIAFRFAYLGVSFDASLGVDPESPLVLKADLGPIPYSAENALGRRIARTMLMHARLPRGGLSMDMQGNLHLELAATPTCPRSPVSVVATVVALLMDARPYLQLLELAQRRPRQPVRS